MDVLDALQTAAANIDQESRDAKGFLVGRAGMLGRVRVPYSSSNYWMILLNNLSRDLQHLTTLRLTMAG